MSTGFANGVSGHHEQDVGVVPHDLACVDRVNETRREHVMTRSYRPFVQHMESLPGFHWLRPKKHVRGDPKSLQEPINSQS